MIMVFDNRLVRENIATLCHPRILQIYGTSNKEIVGMSAAATEGPPEAKKFRIDLPTQVKIPS